MDISVPLSPPQRTVITLLRVKQLQVLAILYTALTQRGCTALPIAVNKAPASFWNAVNQQAEQAVVAATMLIAVFLAFTS